MSEVRDVLREVRVTIGSEGDSGERERLQARVKRMLTAMGLAEEDLDTELRDHRQQQEAAAAAEADGRPLNGVDTLAEGEPGEEGLGQDGQGDDVDMEVEGATGVAVDRDVPGKDTGLSQAGSAEHNACLMCMASKDSTMVIQYSTMVNVFGN